MRSNSECADDDILDYARRMKAVGHPIRLHLLFLIEREEDPCVSDLWKCLKQPQPVISQHLSILKQNGIVSAEIQKTKRVYSIIDPFVRSLIRSIMKESPAIAVQGKEKRKKG